MLKQDNDVKLLKTKARTVYIGNIVRTPKEVSIILKATKNHCLPYAREG